MKDPRSILVMEEETLSIKSRQFDAVLRCGGKVRMVVATSTKIPHVFAELRSEDDVIGEALVKWNPLPKQSLLGIIDVTVPPTQCDFVDIGLSPIRHEVHCETRVSVFDLAKEDFRIRQNLVQTGRPTTITIECTKTLPSSGIVQLNFDGTKKVRYSASMTDVVEVLVDSIPNCERINVLFSVDNYHFLDCGHVDTVPHLNVIFTIPPVIDLNDASDFAVVCSTSASDEQSSFPRHWSLQTQHDAELPVMMTPLKKAEIAFLKNYFGQDEETTNRSCFSRRKGFHSVEAQIDEFAVAFDTEKESFSCKSELELVMSCRAAHSSISLGPLLSSSQTNGAIHYTIPSVSGVIRLLRGERMFLDPTCDRMELALVCKEMSVVSKKKSNFVRTVLARGDAPLTHQNDFFRVQMQKHGCKTCNLRIKFSLKRLEREEEAKRKWLREVNLYAFRSCAVTFSSSPRVLGVSDETIALDFRLSALSATCESVSKSNYTLVSSHWTVPLHNRLDWMIHEVTPDIARINNCVKVSVKGRNFKHAFGATLTASFELENGEVVDQETSMHNNSTIIFDSPVISEPQLTTVKLVFRYATATITTNLLPFEYLPMPALDQVLNRYIPRSTASTLSLQGGVFFPHEQLKTFVYSPVEDVRPQVKAGSALNAAQAFIRSRDGLSSIDYDKRAASIAFSVAAGVREHGGSNAAAAAAASAAYVTAISCSENDVEDIDTAVVDAVASLGGTDATATMAGEAALLAHMQYRGDGRVSKRKGPELAPRDHITYRSDRFLFGHRLSSLAVMDKDTNGVEKRYLEFSTNFVGSNKITCSLPANLGVDSIHFAFSRTAPGNKRERPAYVESKTTHLFAVGALWPACGDLHGGTVIRISGKNLEKALPERTAELSAKHSTHEEEIIPNVPLPTLKRHGSASDQNSLQMIGTNSLARELVRSNSFKGHKSLLALDGTKAQWTKNVGTAVPCPKNSLPRQCEDERPVQESLNSVSVSPTTGRVLHRTIVKGSLGRLNKGQMHHTSATGAMAFANLAGTLTEADARSSKGESLSFRDMSDCVCPSTLSSAVVGVAASEYAASAGEGDCVIQCKVPSCPATLLAKAKSFTAFVEVSLNGSEGPFSSDGARFQYVLPPILKAISPDGSKMIPGLTVIRLYGNSLGDSATTSVHISLISANKAGKSQYGQGRATLERIVVAYELENEDGSANGDLERNATHVNVKLPFFVRRRFANRQPNRLQLFGRCMFTTQALDLNLWLHSQPIKDDVASRKDTKKRAAARDIDSGGECGTSPSSQHLSPNVLSRQKLARIGRLSRVASLFKPGTSIKRGKRDGASKLPRAPPATSFPKVGRPRRPSMTTMSTTTAGQQSTIEDVSQTSQARAAPPKRRSTARYEEADPDCLVQTLGVEVSPNGVDWSDRASRSVDLGMPYTLTRIEPASGPLAGGTNITIHGQHFPVGCEKCRVAFLCIPVYSRQTLLDKAPQSSEKKRFASISRSLAADAAARTIQRIVRGAIYRAVSKHGSSIPCAWVPAVVESPTRISCNAPGSLCESIVDVVVSFDGKNFEWAPTGKLRELRIRSALAVVGVSDSEAETMAADIAANKMNANEVYANLRKKTGMRASRLDAAKVLLEPLLSAENTFNRKIHLSYEYYVAPEIVDIQEIQPPYTDAFYIVGTAFKSTARNIFVHFRMKVVGSDDSQVYTMPATVVEEDLISVVSPTALPNEARVEVFVSFNKADFTNTLAFVVFKKPRLDTIVPSCGPLQGGSFIEIRGDNFRSPSNEIKVRLTLASGSHLYKTAIACVESPNTLTLKLPSFEKLLEKARMEAKIQRDESSLPIEDVSSGNNNVIRLSVDLCIDMHSNLTEKPLDFLLYEFIPKIDHMLPQSGLLSGGYAVRIFGSDFINTNALAVRIVPLPTDEDFEEVNANSSTCTVGRRSKQRMKSSTDTIAESEFNQDALHNLVSQIDIRCVYHTDKELSFVVPSLDQHPGQYLVQVTLNAVEFTYPHEQCLLTLYSAHRSEVRDFLTQIKGPQDVATSREACRQWRILQSSRHRPLARSEDSARSNNRAFSIYSSASDKPHVVRPSLAAILRAIDSEMQDKTCVDVTEIAVAARKLEFPLQGLEIPSFDTHQALSFQQYSATTTTTADKATISSDADTTCSTVLTPAMIPVPAWQTKSLVSKLQHILRDVDHRGRKELVDTLKLAFSYVEENRVCSQSEVVDSPGLTYGELCEHLMMALFPQSSQVDLLELWQILDPLQVGFVTLNDFLLRLRGKRPSSPSPGPSHYRANALILKRNGHAVAREALTLDLYDSRPSLIIPMITNKVD